MKRLTLIAAILLVVQTSVAQNLLKKIQSFHLEDSREIKIGLPKSYKSNPDKKYPLILTLDGDYLFDPVLGTVKYMSYWEDMPESIVVGIKQKNTRREDCQYDSNTDLPEYKAKNFYNFISTELITYLQDNYRLSKFKMIVGHDYTANFINYFLTENPLFQAYINLSPEYAPSMTEKISAALSSMTKKTWYYLATGQNDAKNLRSDIIIMDDELKKIENENVVYKFNDFKDTSHYSLVNYAVPRALNDIFSIYRPISKKEYKEVILNLEYSPYDYLLEKYKIVENLTGVKEIIRVNDFVAISTALEKKEDWKELERLGKLARRTYPDYMLGNYYLAKAYENTDKIKLAMKTYQNGYLLEEVSFITKDFMLDKAERIKEDFGYR